MGKSRRARTMSYRQVDNRCSQKSCFDNEWNRCIVSEMRPYAATSRPYKNECAVRRYLPRSSAVGENIEIIDERT
jgi:hypothetical protein